MNIHVDDNNEVLLGVQTDEIDLRAGDTINLGSSDYNDLTNKPSIEGVELIGDVSLDDLGVAYAEDIPTDVSELINDAGYITSPNVVFCTCDTAAGTAAKTATIVSGTLTELHAGDQAIVKFVNTNTASNPTLKIGNTDAKAIKRYGTTAVGTTQATSWTAGATFTCVYDGTNWALVSWINTAYSEISEANITSGSSSSTGLISGRRVKKAVETFAPVTSVNGQTGDVVVTDGVSDVEVNGESVVNEQGIAEITIPPLVTDLGEIDGDQYDWEIKDYLNTLQETGSYTFLWDGFRYWVDIETLEVDGTTTVQQVYWGTEEGGGTVYYRNVVIENGEIVNSDITNYMTFDEVNTAFARITHNHVRFSTQAQSIWDYCNTVAMTNITPIVIYFDSSTNKTYLIETYVGARQPVYKMQKVTEMNDPSYFCQRSTYYYSARDHWTDWYKFTGTVFTP